MTEVTLPANNWRPRKYQRGFWSYMQKTPHGARAILCHHRRAGKDHTAINWAAVASQMRVGLYIHIFPYANQGRRVIWNGIDGNGVKFLDAFPPELVERRSDLEMRLVLKNGSIFQVLGADDPDKLVGINCVGAIFSEYALMDPMTLDLVMPILNENGGWAIFPSTPRGENHFHKLVGTAKSNPNWYVSVETVDTTGAVNPALIEEERQRGVDEALIQQEYYCSFTAPLQGAYYERQMNQITETKQIGPVPFEPSLPVHTAWDLGMSDATAIFFFQVERGGGVRIFDYYEASGESLGHYVRVVDDRATKGQWTLGRHYAPHDIRVKELGTGITRWQTACDLGLRFEVLDKDAFEDGIEAGRQLLPKCWIDEKRCKRAIEALKSYRKEWDERLRVFRSKPLHDWSSHAADAFRYLAMGLKGRPPTRADAVRPSHSISDYDAFGDSNLHTDDSPHRTAGKYRSPDPDELYGAVRFSGFRSDGS